MIKLISITIGILIFAACSNSKTETKNATVDNSYKEVSLNASGDTNFVVIQQSNLRFIVHYYNNKPQGVLLQDSKIADNLKPHFTEDKKGVFININPESGLINSVGYRYLKKDEGADIAIDELGNAQFFTSWLQYSNSGKSYDITQVDKGYIKIYTIKDGEKIDSSLYLKK